MSVFDKLRLYSILTFLVAVLVFVCYKYYCNTRLDISRYKYFWDKILFSKLLNFSGWMLFGAAAGVSATFCMLRIQIKYCLVNF